MAAFGTMVAAADAALDRLAREDSEEAVAATVAVLDDLKAYRQFDRLLPLAESLCQRRPADRAIRKHYAQALLDTNQPTLAADVLRPLIDGAAPDDALAVDAQGLFGRAMKDVFLAAPDPSAPAAVAAARAALRAYLGPFRDPLIRSYYHGINAVAVLHAAHERAVVLAPGLAAADLAGELLAVLMEQRGAAPPSWWWATKAEAHVARRDWTAAEEALGQYIAHPGTAVFNLGSTLRQFRDLWAVQDMDRRGAQLLQMLEARYLEAARAAGVEDGADLQMTPDHLRQMRDQPDIAPEQLERVLGRQGTQSLTWYRAGLGRAGSVGSVADELGNRLGTCFAVDPDEFGLTLAPDEMLVLTNHHVVNAEGLGRAITPAEARIRFEAADPPVDGETLKVKALIAEAPSLSGQDYALLCIQAPGRRPEPIPFWRGLPEANGAARVYLIGYPLGGGLQFSLQDNLLLAHEGPPEGAPDIPARVRVQYFAPTDPGSSGSPVFDDKWRCIALHHAGAKFDPRNQELGLRKLNGQKGRHSANQGIWIGSILDHAASAPGGNRSG